MTTAVEKPTDECLVGSACGACPSWLAEDENGEWHCCHGSWKMNMGSWELFQHDHDDCPGNCPQHPLSGDGGNRNMTEWWNSWGDMWFSGEEERVSRMSPTEKEVAYVEAAQREQELAVKLAEVEAKREQLQKEHTRAKAERDAKEHAIWAAAKEKRTGQRDMCRFHLLLKEAEERVQKDGPCCMKSTLSYKGPRGDLRSITVENALEGCYSHSKGKCPFRHGEETAPKVEMRQFNLGRPVTRQPSRW